MSKPSRKTLLILGGVAAVSLALGVVAWMPPADELQRSEIGRQVLPAFESKAGLVGMVTVTTSEETYHIVRAPQGWAVAEKGGYPVTDAKMQELTEALSHITYAKAMTRDDRKFDRIGLGDPAHGGTGALIEVSDGEGVDFAKLLVGYRDGQSYVRKPDDLQAWAVANGVLPPLQRASAWLDLDVVRVAAGDIAGADVRPSEGPPYRLQSTGTGVFALVPPNDKRQLFAALGPKMVAEALTRLSPTDVAPATRIAVGAPVAEHVTRLASGVAIVVRCWRMKDHGWVTVGAATAEGAPPDAVSLAQGINAKTAPWAFALTELDWGAFATPLNVLAE
jgi:hypothetical protein